MIKILIADDQQLIRDSIKIILESNKDFSVTDTVGNGKEVLASIEKNKPDIILMDVRMPIMDGTVCTKYVKEKYPDITEKVFRLFSKMAQSNYAISVNDKETKDFSKSEWCVIQQVGLGLSNKEIAAKLFLSEGTVRNYISKILEKLDLRDRTQLAIWAVQTGVTSENIDPK